ncbi:RAMP superfamily CRISPR-associated protein [Clostridium sp. HV4-5-A1G]|uniref:RAMP superfamily CRISPR-associated protein n=1 Tax=Clostridium sp. HV4-5-A1G TaxID=2004595 RepID=UPI0016898C73|nr:RAMP superfamily CRISPR-associated protein [Clostridium sp. HV4-5-A1G]
MNIIAISQDPIYIGTGGFAIGRVDNTIVRDPIARIPKIPGTSLAGTWRYYMTITLYSYFNDEYKKSRSKRSKVEKADFKNLFIKNAKSWVTGIEGNRYAAIKCAGQDEEPDVTVEESQKSDTGHCGSCIVCKTFGYSKKNKSERGMAYFSDLNILLFPVYTRLGTMWITSKNILCSAGIDVKEEPSEDKVIILKNGIKTINLGWLNLGIEDNHDNTYTKIENYLKMKEDLRNQKSVLQNIISKGKIIIVSDSIVAQIINSNLETRTSVSIDPITGAAKDKALFTSEAIPRGTVFYGNVRIEERPLSEKPQKKDVEEALKESKKYFETLGIGGMTTRGFGRIKILDRGEGNGN